MRKRAVAAMGVAAILAATCVAAQAAGTYYPYEHYDQYYKEHSVTPPPPPEAPLPPTEPLPEVKEKRPESPIMLREAPEFLFPPGLGFGVAIGVPYDMFYASKGFYVFKGGAWYRAASYKGPWIQIPITRVPPELRKQNLAKIHKLRNEEFGKYWKNKSGYRGKTYRPTDEIPPPLKDESAPRERKPAQEGEKSAPAEKRGK